MHFLRFALGLALFVALLFSVGRAQVTDPHVTSWLTSKSAQYARVWETASDKSSNNAVSTWPRSGLTNGGGGQSTAAYSDVQRVAYSTNYVYIQTTGLASYTMGNWVTPNNLTYTSWPTNRAAIHRIPRTPSIPTIKSKSGGNGGVLVNGVFIWENGDAQSYSTTTSTVSMSGQGIWNRLAGIAEAFNFDTAYGHQPSSGAYHNHINPIALRYQLGDNVTYNSSTKTYSEATTLTRHSPIIGWANDGLPIYGPYGYSSAMDSTSGIRRMVSGFVKRDGTNGTTNLATTGRVTLPVWAASVQGKSQTLTSSEYGPATTTTYSVGGGVTSTYSIGLFAEDYEYLGDLGKTQGVDFDLNRQNVRYCVTPEYPSGTYAYFVCISSTGATVFPDIINQEFFGTPVNGTGTVTTINEAVTEYVDAGPAATIAVTGTASGSNVALSWNSAEGATYKVESSPDNSAWTTLSSTVTSGGLTTSYTATGSTNYYRVTLTAISTYDTGGTYGTPVGKTTTLLYGTPVTAPTITTHPVSQTVTAGTSVSFTVVASGSAPLTYQWKKGGTAISGATNASYTLTTPQTSDSGSYSVTVTNSAGSATSSAAILTVNASPTSPTISTQPASQSVTAGSSVIFTVAAAGTAPLAYAWSRNGSGISGATAASYTIASAQTADAGDYTVTITNGVGTLTSQTAVLAVIVVTVAPAISTPPTAQSVTIGSAVNFTVAATGTTPFSYRWTKGGLPIAGATTSSYALTSVQASDAADYAVTVTNSAGSATSTAATLTVLSTPPTITSQPVDVSVTVGSGAVFTMAASGTSPLSYQWYKNAAPINGATGTSYTIVSVQVTDAASYLCVVTNGAGSASTQVAVLSIAVAPTAPSITTQPANATVTAGGSASFTVAASGTSPLSYQWYQGVTAIAGATSAAYSMTSIQVSAAGSYTCVVSNSAGSATSDAATLTVNLPPVAPSIATQPASVAATAGGRVTFAVVASGTAPLSYQWVRAGVVIAGATSASFTIATVQSTDAGSYACLVSNTVGSVMSSTAVLTVTAAPVAPTIATQPASLNVTAGAVATFTVTANGSGPLFFQWSKNGTAIVGATSSTLVLASVQTADAGSYVCTVGNSVGSVTSATATLAVAVAAVAPSIAIGPRNVTTSTGSSATFSVVATGAAPLSYQWYKGVVAISGATTATYRIAAVQAGDAGGYACVVSNAAGSVTSAAATLTISNLLQAPAITLQPVSLTSQAGGVAAFFVAATGTAPLSYRWLRNGLLIPNATASSYVLAEARSEDAGSYSVIVANSVGVVVSEPATLTVPAAAPALRAGIVNLGVRTRMGGAVGSPIIGFVLAGGGGGKRIVVRAVGPTLASSFGLTGALPDPQLQLWSGTSLLASNDDWLASDAPAMVAVGAFPLALGGRDAATQITLAPGAYTTPVSATNGASGIVLVEAYDGASNDTSTRLVNASARAYVGTGEDVLIPGFVIEGEGQVRVLVRAIGPGLVAFGVPGTLADPQITLFSGVAAVAANDNWSRAANAAEISAASTQAGAFALASGSNDAALLVTLSAGSYTASVSGVGGGTGTALVEIYVLP